jgi:hypothetical protein
MGEDRPRNAALERAILPCYCALRNHVVDFLVTPAKAGAH